MKQYTAKYVWDSDKDAFVERGIVAIEDGCIVSPNPEAEVEDLGNVALFPGLINAHSHAFQRAIRGRTEVQESATDDFWSWRSAMYRAALSMTAEDIEAISRYAFYEMLRSGVTTVGEFHYVHHQPDGSEYSDPNELAHAVIRAAKSVGIGIVLLDVAYERGGFSKPAQQSQRRFTSTIDRYLERVEALRSDYNEHDHVAVGCAPHSLRAVGAESMNEISTFADQTDSVLHIHVSEQVGEVESCISTHGTTPVAWMAERGWLSDTTTLVHATHVTDAEIEAIAHANANVCVCPTTERNLGDGMFRTRAFFDAGVPLCLGSDSHIEINLWEDVRELEYLERLRLKRRNAIATTDKPSTARNLLPALSVWGNRSLGIRTGMARDDSADFLAIDLDHFSLLGADQSTLLDHIVFTMAPDAVKASWVGGRQVLEDGRHEAHDMIVDAFKKTMERLWNDG